MAISLPSGRREKNKRRSLTNIWRKLQTTAPKERSERPECYVYTRDGNHLQHQSSPGKQRGCSIARSLPHIAVHLKGMTDLRSDSSLALISDGSTMARGRSWKVEKISPPMDVTCSTTAQNSVRSNLEGRRSSPNRRQCAQRTVVQL